MTSTQVMQELKKMGSDSIKRILMNHGAKEPIYGVKIGDMKVIQKKVKKDHNLAMELYATGVYDAMYLAGLIADESKMTKKDIENWMKNAQCAGICDYTVAWVAAESAYGWELGMKWIDSPDENTASTGWNTLGGVISLKDDKDLDIPLIKKLLARIKKDIHSSQNRVRYAMNTFVMSAGIYIKELTGMAKEIGASIGNVEVNMGNTDCKVPFAPDYINKAMQRGSIGKKKKTVKC